MVTGALIPMPTDPGLTRLQQWLSPSYPIGAFAYSHGLETAIGTCAIISSDDLRMWLTDLLKNGAGYSDPILLVAAYRSENAEALQDIEQQARAFAPSKERLAETALQGAAFCQTTSAISDHDIPDLTYPVGLGYAARRHGLPLDLTVHMYLHSFVSNLVAAAQRLMRVGQVEGQRILTDLAPLIAQITQDALTSDLTDLSGSCFLADIATMQHETQYSRMFRS
ncbi:urease accessory protein UreF [Parasedimentitalea huanghaiensis]|nr:urease accessory protein UreF [Zongyanglinia huanghaiensis]